MRFTPPEEVTIPASISTIQLDPTIPRFDTSAFQTLEATDVLPSVKFYCVGTVSQICDSQPWYYLSRPLCHFGTKIDGHNFVCASAACSLFNRIVHPVPWYRLILKTKDQHGCMELILFGETTACIIGVPVDNIIALPGVYYLTIPIIFEGIIGKQFLFTVCVRQSMSSTKFIAMNALSVPDDYNLIFCCPPGYTCIDSP